MKNAFITTNSAQTQELGEILAKELKGGEIICLMGELGSGKTTFAQGVLHGLGAKKPHTSPTFVVMKEYKNFSKVRPFPSPNGAVGIPQGQTLKNVYHIDAYRVGPKDILNLGWEEIIANRNNIIIVEWAERINRIIPKDAMWIFFKHVDNNQRKMSLSLKLKMKSAKSQLKV